MYDGLNIARLASPLDKDRFGPRALENPAPFTLDNIRGTFGKFIVDPRGNILRGLAEVFCGLDDFYKSHDKVKIGVAGLPKRIILSNVNEYSSYGRAKLEAVLNALACYQGKPLIEWRELSALMTNGAALLVDGELAADRTWDKPTQVIGRGIRLKRFANGNGHVIFEPATLLDINRALAEFYGDVLPDTTDEKPAHRQPSTAIAKDLQYYPTPIAVAKRIVDDLYHGSKALLCLSHLVVMAGSWTRSAMLARKSLESRSISAGSHSLAPKDILFLNETFLRAILGHARYCSTVW